MALPLAGVMEGGTGIMGKAAGIMEWRTSILRRRTGVCKSAIPTLSRVTFHPFTKNGRRDAVCILFTQNQVPAKQHSESVTHSFFLKSALLYKLCEGRIGMFLEGEQACLLFKRRAFPQILEIGMPPAIQ